MMGRFLSEIADDIMGQFKNGSLSEPEICAKLKDDDPEAVRTALKMLIRDGMLQIDLSIKTEYKLMPGPKAKAPKPKKKEGSE